MEHPIVNKMPEFLFVQLMTNKALILKKHLRDTESDMQLVANINPSMATIKLYDITQEEDSQKLYITIFNNLGDIHEQLCQLWLQLNYHLKGILFLFDYLKIGYNTYLSIKENSNI